MKYALHGCILSTLLLLSLFASAQTQIGADIDGEAAEDRSGIAISLADDGLTLAIGAFNNDGGGENSGHARIYKFVSGSWQQFGGDINGQAIGDLFGASVSLSANGRTVAIGGYLNDDAGKRAGHVRVFAYNGSSWVQLGQNINGMSSEDRAGFTVSLSANGQRVALGAPGDATKPGYAAVYTLTNGSWSLTGNVLGGEAVDDKFGYSVSLSDDGRTVAVGGRNNGNPNGSGAGHTRVYQLVGSTWTQLGQDIDGKKANDASGWSVSLAGASGRTVAIGAINNDDSFPNAGQTRVYSFVGNRWVQLGQDLNGEATGDAFGFNVALSGNGQRLAVGAYQNDGNGTNAGHTRIYYLIDNRWEKVGRDIDGEAAGDESGYTVTLDQDGETLAIGAPKNDGNGFESGHVRAYFLSASLPVELNYFTLSTEAGGNRLDWQTAREEDNAGFEIQHSTDGIGWSELAWQDGAGNSTLAVDYQYLHRTPAPGTNYYRLVQVDFDGTIWTSPIVSGGGAAAEAKGNLSIFPNPVGRHLNWSSPLSTTEAPVTISITDANGRVILRTLHTASPVLVGTLPSGIYTLTLTSGRTTESRRFVKR